MYSSESLYNFQVNIFYSYLKQFHWALYWSDGVVLSPHTQTS